MDSKEEVDFYASSTYTQLFEIYYTFNKIKVKMQRHERMK